MANTKSYSVLPALFFVGLVAFLWHALGSNSKLLPSALIGKHVPKFNLPTLQDSKQRFSNKMLLGHISLVNVWASWCENCQLEHPFLMELALQKKVPIYGLDYKDKRKDALAQLEKIGNPFQQIGFDKEGTVGLNLGVYGTPETFVVDKHGVIRYKHVGVINEADWQKNIYPLIQELQTES